MNILKKSLDIIFTYMPEIIVADRKCKWEYKVAHVGQSRSPITLYFKIQYRFPYEKTCTRLNF